MGCFQKTALSLLVLSISLSACSGQFANFSCTFNEVIEKEYNENATMSCRNNMKITKVALKRCESCEECNFPLINTIDGTYSSEQGRIFLEQKNMGQVAVLHIQKTKMSDQGVYVWYLGSDNGHRQLCTTLRIRAPETEPNLAVSGTKLTCESPLGHQHREIHWFDGNGTNLTGSASLLSEDAGDGLTRITSTLHGILKLTALEYCCTVLYDVHTGRNKTKCLRDDKAFVNYFNFSPTSVPDIPMRSKEHIITIVVLLFLVLCSFVAVLYYKYRHRESRRNAADLFRSLVPFLQQYKGTEENQPSCNI